MDAQAASAKGISGKTSQNYAKQCQQGPGHALIMVQQKQKHARVLPAELLRFKSLGLVKTGHCRCTPIDIPVHSAWRAAIGLEGLWISW